MTMSLPRFIISNKSGVLLVTPGGKKKVAAPIRFRAIGHRTADDTQMAEITFVTRKGERLSEYFEMSQTLPRNRHKIIERLANKNYAWPSDRKQPDQIIEAVLAGEPDARFTMVPTPGWYDGTIVNARRQYGKGSRVVLDPDPGAHVAKMTLGQGSLEGWQETVAVTAKSSSRLRLTIGASFAALFLRPLGMDSFALNLFGTTSAGKSKGGLSVAGSVAGLIGENGLPGWADTLPALEQLAMGHRDGVLPLDETSDEGDARTPMHKKAKFLAFTFGRNRGRNLAKIYEKQAKLIAKGFRVIALSTSEFSLKVLAEKAGEPRLGGEEVRFIDVPAIEQGDVGIFDRMVVPNGRDPVEYAQKVIDKLRLDAETHQGFAIDKFNSRLANDPESAFKTVRAEMKNFTARVSSQLVTGADRRICANFALIYSAAALAIEYKILPWGKKNTRKAITKCMETAFATLRDLSPSNAMMALSTSDVIGNLKDKLAKLDLVALEKRKPCSADESRRRHEADGFCIGEDLYVKSKGWKAISPSDRKVLAAHKILKTETRGDVLTVSKKIAGIKQKLRYYIINSTALDHALRPPADRGR